jgi:hypothetical protein
MKQTAVEWLVNKLNNDFENNDFLISYANEISQAKEMEKQQIIDAYNKGCSEIHLYYEFIKDENITQTKEPFSAEQYYNETFNK